MYRRPSGFTLIQIVSVLVGLGLIAAIFLRRVWSGGCYASGNVTRVQMVMLATAIDAFASDVGRYPTSQEGLAALVQQPVEIQTWRGPYLRKQIPPDGWGNPYHYLMANSSAGESYVLESFGADGRPGGEGKDQDIARVGPVVAANARTGDSQLR